MLEAQPATTFLVVSQSTSREHIPGTHGRDGQLNLFGQNISIASRMQSLLSAN